MIKRPAQTWFNRSLAFLSMGHGCPDSRRRVTQTWHAFRQARGRGPGRPFVPGRRHRDRHPGDPGRVEPERRLRGRVRPPLSSQPARGPWEARRTRPQPAIPRRLHLLVAGDRGPGRPIRLAARGPVALQLLLPGRAYADAQPVLLRWLHRPEHLHRFQYKVSITFSDQTKDMGDAPMAFSEEASVLANHGLDPSPAENVVRIILDAFDALQGYAVQQLYTGIGAGFFVRDFVMPPRPPGARAFLPTGTSTATSTRLTSRRGLTSN